MNYVKENSKIDDHMDITFQMRRHFVQYQDYSKSNYSRSNFSIQPKQSFKIISEYRCF